MQAHKSRLGPAGLHLFSRSSGLNVLLDEIVVPSTAWSKAPAYMSIALTNACDLECAYCYAPKHASRLNIERVIGWCVEADKHDCLGIGFGGGEPTLFPGFSEMLRSVSAMTSLSLSFTTHGHRMTDELLDELRGSVHFIRVSMDGVGATYERLRNRSFQALVERLRAIRTCSRYGINLVVNRDTIGELDQVLETAIASEASQLLLLPEVRSGCCTLSPSDLDRLERWIKQNADCFPLAISGLASESLDIPRLQTSAGSRTDHDFLHVDADGVLKRCAFDCSGVTIADHPSLMDAVDALRASTPLTILATRSGP